MSIMDIDKADENIDYEVIYKKKFEEIENNIKYIRDQYSVDNLAINKLLNDLNFLKNEVFRLDNTLYKVRNNIDVLRIMLNQLLPEDQQIFFKDIS